MSAIAAEIILAVLFVLGPPAEYVPVPEPCLSDLTVGCYYFPGHFNPMRWMPFQRTGFPTPLLGYYRDGEPEVADWHIKWAVEHGIDFFAFDWYCHYQHGPSLEHNKALDRGFLRARYRNHMKFTLMWCNENKDERYTAEHMTRLARILTQHYFNQPNYLRIDGDNVLIISVPAYFLNSFGPEGTARVFEKMAAISQQAGCGGLFPVAKGHHNQGMLKQAGFRAITAYNYPDAGMNNQQRKARQAPYADMVRGYEEIWKQVTADSALPYIVPVSPGWDSRPWCGDRALVRTNSRPRILYQMCTAAKRYVDPKLKMVIAECWNEFGEGSYVEPTAQYGFGYLDAMRDAFCSQNPQHDDIVPASIGRQVPVFKSIPRPVEELMAAGENMLYNGDIETHWGWVSFKDSASPYASPGHQGRRCLLIPPGDGVKSQWMMPITDKPLQISFWYRLPAGATLTVTAALFKSNRWLKRYCQVAKLSGTGNQWTRFSKKVTVTDTEADRFDIEFVADGGEARVDDVDIRVAPANSP